MTHLPPSSEETRGEASNLAQLRALGWRESRIAQLEQKVQRLQAEVVSQGEALAEAQQAASGLLDPNDDTVRQLIEQELQNLRTQLEQKSAASKGRQLQLQQLVQDKIRLQARLSDARAAFQIRSASSEKMLMELHDRDGEAPPQPQPPAQPSVRGNPAPTLFDGVRERRFVPNFGAVPPLTSTDDPYTAHVLEASAFCDTLSRHRKELKWWVREATARHDGLTKTLWTLLENPHLSKLPKRDASKAILETQRKSKLAAADLARKMNAAIQEVAEREKQLKRDVVKRYEEDKAASRAGAATMCVFPDPPPPAVAALKRRAAVLQTEADAARQQHAAAAERTDALREAHRGLLNAAHQLHASLYGTLKAVWTHRYRFTEAMEDPVARYAPQGGGRSAKKAAFAGNAVPVLEADKHLLETFQKYVTSDELYLHDMAAAARQQRATNARRGRLPEDLNDLEMVLCPLQSAVATSSPPAAGSPVSFRRAGRTPAAAVNALGLLPANKAVSS